MGTINQAPTVLTLDAGGTNFVFSALRDGIEIGESITLPSNAHEIKACWDTIVSGFRQVMERENIAADAISFAFPGPADYPNGIIGDLPNLPAFRGGVALGPKLRKEFGIPVYINNDGNLFALGEAMYGLLPQVNQMLKDSGSRKRFRNLVGLTLGTGFGGGIVVNGELLVGDNSNAGEVWLMRNRLFPASNAEENIGARAMIRKFKQYSGGEIPGSVLEIFEIAIGKREGNKDAALKVYAEMAIILGDTIGTLLNLIDGIVVLGGGISASHALFMDVVLNEINSKYVNSDGQEFSRTISRAYNLQRPDQLEEFLLGGQKLIDSNGLGKLVYDAVPVTGIGISRLGTSRAVAAGAYAWAVKNL